MTPIVLLEQLQAFTEKHTRDIILPTKAEPKQEPIKRPPEVWKMRLPNKPAQTSKAPYILLQLINGADGQDEGSAPESECYVRVVVCVYDVDASEGALNLLNVITRLRIGLLKQRVIGYQFTLRMPLEYLIYPDDTAPFFMGEMMTVWEMPTIEREVPELWPVGNLPSRPEIQF